MSEIKMLSPEEKWEQATLANNFIFYKVMRHHPDACRHLIEILLNIKIEKMIMHSEETVELEHDAKGIRLDVFVKDENRMFDVEVQLENTGDLAERTRYYQALMDLDTLKSGEPYKKLRDSHVIFICMKDIFKNMKKNLPVYTFENVCLEDNCIKLNDRAVKHFFIAPACAKMGKDEEVRNFFEFLVSNYAENKYTSELKEYVKAAKQNMQWRIQYMTWERMENYKYNEGHEAGLAEGKKVGILEGSRQKAIEAARSLFINGVSVELIAKSLGMTKEEVLEITKDLVTQIKD